MTERFTILRRPLIALAAMISLTACKADIELSIFASDIQAVADGATDRAVTTVIGVEALSCSERGPAALSALQSAFPKAEFIGCRDGGMETFAEYRVPLPLAKMDTATPPPAAMNVVIAPYTETKTDLIALLFINDTGLQAIVDALPKEFQYSMSGDFLPAISFRIHNDTPTNWTFTVQGVFLDGAAIQLPTDVTLEPREETVVKLSDVGNAAVRGNRPILFFISTK